MFRHSSLHCFGCVLTLLLLAVLNYADCKCISVWDADDALAGENIPLEFDLVHSSQAMRQSASPLHPLFLPQCVTTLMQAVARPSSSPFVLVSSAGSRYLHTAASTGFERTIFSSVSEKSSPLLFYHELSLDRLRGQNTASTERLLSSLLSARDACALDLFTAVPRLLQLLTSPHSCIDEFYRLAGHREPFEGDLRVKSGKLLVRKVASMYHAMKSLPLSTTMVWLDTDVVQTSPLDAAFAAFVRAYDLVYVPFSFCRYGLDDTCISDTLHPSPSEERTPLLSLLDARYRIDSGVLAMRVSAAALKWLRLLLAHYDGGAVAAAQACLCAAPGEARSSTCVKHVFSRNLYFDDLFVWTWHLHMQASKRRPLLRNFSLGWFATGSAKGCAKGCPGDQLLQAKLDSLDAKWTLTTDGSDPPGICACVAAADHVSPFNLYHYFVHYLGSGPYSSAFSVLTNTDKGRARPPEIIFARDQIDQSPGFFHKRLEALAAHRPKDCSWRFPGSSPALELWDAQARRKNEAAPAMERHGDWRARK